MHGWCAPGLLSTLWRCARYATILLNIKLKVYCHEVLFVLLQHGNAAVMMANKQKTSVVKELDSGTASDLEEHGAVGGSGVSQNDSPPACKPSASSASEEQGQTVVTIEPIVSTNAVVELPGNRSTVTSGCTRINPTEQAHGDISAGSCRSMPIVSALPPGTAAGSVSSENPVLPQPAKKRSHFWNFLKRSKRPPALPQCNESGQDNESVVSVEASGCFSRGGICTRNDGHHSGAKSSGSHRGRRERQAPDSPLGLSNLRHLSFGAGSRSFRLLADSQLMTVVVPAPCVHTFNDIGARTRTADDALVRSVDIDGVGESSSNPIGYPHIHFAQSLSSSSSSSSSGISAPLAPAPPTPDYPPLCSSVPTVHTQVDYMHCLVPDLLELTNRMFYWGVMDRYEAEKLLDGRPEGTFLVRDSAQEEFLFSVSFRRYGRSLHARIEQWNHRFSFDSHDLGVFAAPSVCALVEHYKDPAACLFFEPMLTLPLARTYPFTLQHLCRAVICSRIRYDDVSLLRLPARIQDYLKYYHYKQRICVRRFESPRVVTE